MGVKEKTHVEKWRQVSRKRDEGIPADTSLLRHCDLMTPSSSSSFQLAQQGATCAGVTDFSWQALQQTLHHTCSTGLHAMQYLGGVYGLNNDHVPKLSDIT